jgi:hypothetical protein
MSDLACPRDTPGTGSSAGLISRFYVSLPTHAAPVRRILLKVWEHENQVVLLQGSNERRRE